VNELRWRYWLDKLTSKRSLATLGLAAASFVGWVSTQNPTFGWLMLGSGGAWSALMYYIFATGEAGRETARPQRQQVVAELEEQLKPFVPPVIAQADQGRAQRRLTQLRRIARLENLILNHLESTPSSVTVLSPAHEQEIIEIVDQAIELTRRRLLLLRALRDNPADVLQRDLELLQRRRVSATERVRAEIDELIKLKQEQLQNIARWNEDLQVTELNLDQIEAFLEAVAYDQTVNDTNVSQRISRLHSRIQARKESLEELEQRINQASLL
jgi:hypothetical protein